MTSPLDCITAASNARDFVKNGLLNAALSVTIQRWYFSLRTCPGTLAAQGNFFNSTTLMVVKGCKTDQNGGKNGS